MRGRTTPKGATQKELVLNYMKDHGGITQLEATRELGCTRLGARVWDLSHKDGIPIVSEMVTVKNRFGQKTVVKRYRLLNAPTGDGGLIASATGDGANDRPHTEEGDA